VKSRCRVKGFEVQSHLADHIVLGLTVVSSVLFFLSTLGLRDAVRLLKSWSRWTFGHCSGR
jgi:hypothetical protein